MNIYLTNYIKLWLTHMILRCLICFFFNKIFLKNQLDLFIFFIVDTLICHWPWYWRPCLWPFILWRSVILGPMNKKCFFFFFTCAETQACNLRKTQHLRTQRSCAHVAIIQWSQTSISVLQSTSQSSHGDH